MNPRATGRKGFTLVELLVATTLGALAMTALLSCFVFLGRSFTRLAHAQTLAQQGRIALSWLQSDVARALAVKSGTSPTVTEVTLELPEGDVTYTYDPTAFSLRRRATFGSVTDLVLLNGRSCHCTALEFSYYTGTRGSPADQLNPGAHVPFSIKQLRLAFVLETPASHAAATRARHEIVSAQLLLRQRQSPDGS